MTRCETVRSLATRSSLDSTAVAVGDAVPETAGPGTDVSVAVTVGPDSAQPVKINTNVATVAVTTTDRFIGSG